MAKYPHLLHRLSIRQLLLGWGLSATLAVLVLAATALISNRMIHQQQQRLTEVALPLVMSSLAIDRAVTGFTAQKSRILTARTSAELGQITDTSSLDRAFARAMQRLQLLTGSLPEAQGMLVNLRGHFHDLKTSHGALLSNTRRALELRRALARQVDEIDAQVHLIQDDLEAIRGRISLENARQHRKIRTRLQQATRDDNDLFNSLNQLFSGQQNITERLINRVRDAVLKVVILSHQIPQQNNRDELLDLRDNEIRQQQERVRDTLLSLQRQLRDRPALYQQAQRLQQEFQILIEQVVDAPVSAYRLRMAIIRYQQELNIIQRQSAIAIDNMLHSLADLSALAQQIGTVAAIATRQVTNTSRNMVIIVGLLVGLFTILFVLLLQTRINHPLQQLRLAMHGLSNGRLAKRIDLADLGNDEFRQLAVDFNHFAENNQKTFEDLIRTSKALACNEAQTRAIINGVPDGIITIDDNGRIASCNPRAEEIFHVTRDGLVGKAFVSCLAQEYRGNFDEVLELLRTAGCTDLERQGEEQRGLRADGECFPIWLSLNMISIDSRKLLTAVVADITAYKKVQEEQHKVEALFRTVYENAPVMIAGFDPRGRCILWNRELETNLGWSKDDILNVPDISTRLYPEHADRKRVAEFIQQHDGVFRESSPLARDGTRKTHLWANFLLPDGTSMSTGYDITKRKETEEQLRQLASFDTLTGLPNRALFLDRLGHALSHARRKRTRIALMFLDLDHFKKINDSLGHSIGDKLLIEVAKRLTASVREQDTVARLGGDEFTIILESIAHLDNIGKLADKIIHNLSRPYSLEGHIINISPSIGISLFPDDADDPEILVRNADTAMYHAKDSGRGNFQFYSAELNRAATDRLALESSLRAALYNDEFVLYYQPQIDALSGSIVAVEALLRWQCPEQGLVSPDRFIPILEDTGLIIPVGDWVIREACRQNRAWREQGYPPIRMSVNLSGRQFQGKQLADTIAGTLAETRLKPADLELEITETVLMQDTDATIDTLNALNELGMRLSIDDFGTGYSSLAYLKRFPVHTLKIDRSFIRDIDVDADDAAITEAVIAMSHRLKLEVVAEGVETPEQMVFLKRHHCDKLQGYLIARPLPAGELAELLRQPRTLASGQG